MHTTGEISFAKAPPFVILRYQCFNARHVCNLHPPKSGNPSRLCGAEVRLSPSHRPISVLTLSSHRPIPVCTFLSCSLVVVRQGRSYFGLTQRGQMRSLSLSVFSVSTAVATGSRGKHASFLSVQAGHAPGVMLCQQ